MESDPEDKAQRPNRGIKRTRQGRGVVGQMSDNRDSWVDMAKFSAILFYDNAADWLKWKGDDAPVYDAEDPPVRIEIRYPTQRRPTTFNLTAMTAPELQAFKEFWERAFELAAPICERMDIKAREAFEAGDDSFARLYRPVPRLFIRDELQSEHGSGLQKRPPRLIDRIASDHSAGISQPSDGGSGDNSPATEPSDRGEGSSGILAGDGSRVGGDDTQP